MKVIPKYSFWQRPIRWIKERKVRRLMGLYLDHWWKGGGDEQTSKHINEMLIQGKTKIGDKTHFYGKTDKE